jgi:tRNA modification GTPase
MSYHLDDTICAIATAAGGAARGMVRISGPDAVGIATQLFQADSGESLDLPRHATALSGHVLLEIDAAVRVLPCDLFLWPTARSYTRQPVAELHTLGSPPLLEALLAAACRAGARLAEPGEFTLRAFLAGRIDLTQAEAVLGVIDAQGEQDLNNALVQLAGGLARPLHQLREDLLQLLAELEAGLDFVEEDIQFVSADEVLSRLGSADELLNTIAQQMSARHTADRPPQVALVGPPNAGKSSLFNALMARRAVAPAGGTAPPLAALVSPRRGTTRDYLTATIELDGVRCELVDTAGEDEQINEDLIGRAAQALSAERRAQAAIRAYCVDATQWDGKRPDSSASCELVVVTKADLAHGQSWTQARTAEGPVVVTSSRTGEGLDDLCAALRLLLDRARGAQAGQVVATTADRCRESVRAAQSALRRAAELVIARQGDELVAAELRTALDNLGKVVGTVYTEDLLDRIFSTFCIGK